MFNIIYINIYTRQERLALVKRLTAQGDDSGDENSGKSKRKVKKEKDKARK